MDDAAQKPISSPQKEQEPNVSSYIEKVERQPEIPPEVTRVGVQPVSQPTLTQKDKEAGLEEAKEEVPAATQPEGLIELPLTEDEARSALKVHKNIIDSIVWLANFVLRQFKIIRARKKI